MRLTDTLEKIKASFALKSDVPKDVFIFLVTLLLGTGIFMIGHIFALEDRRKSELQILAPKIVAAASSIDSPGGQLLPKAKVGESKIEHGAYVGSITGHIYHLPSCSGAKRIKEENKVWFADKNDAEAHGYKPAGNCKGL